MKRALVRDVKRAYPVPTKPPSLSHPPSIPPSIPPPYVGPLFTESATGRELKAVDAENSKNLTNDSRRMWQITKAVATPSHPWSKFSTGSLQTLKEDVPPAFDLRDALLRFYAE